MTDPKVPERWWFCPDCGLRDAHKHDVGAHDDCSDCGMDCWRESLLREMLAKAGRHIVSEAERKVLEACAGLDKTQMGLALDAASYTREPEGKWSPVIVAELARRSGIP
jgi:hypothetical protein